MHKLVTLTLLALFPLAASAQTVEKAGDKMPAVPGTVIQKDCEPRRETTLRFNLRGKAGSAVQAVKLYEESKAALEKKAKELGVAKFEAKSEEYGIDNRVDNEEAGKPYHYHANLQYALEEDGDKAPALIDAFGDDNIKVSMNRSVREPRNCRDGHGERR